MCFLGHHIANEYVYQDKIILLWDIMNVGIGIVIYQIQLIHIHSFQKVFACKCNDFRLIFNRVNTDCIVITFD